MEDSRKKMHRSEVLRILGLHKNDFASRFGVTKLGVFGSVVRGGTGNVNDVDIVVEMKKPDLFYLVHIKEELEEAFHCPVDIVHYRQRMNEFLKKRIASEAVYV